MLAPACAPRAGPNVTFRQWPRSACAGSCRPFVRPGAGIYCIQDSHLSLLGHLFGEIQRVDGIVLDTLGVLFCCLDIKLVAFAADAVLQVPHLRLGISLHRLPLALWPPGGLPRLSPAGSRWAARSALTCSMRALTCSLVFSRARLAKPSMSPACPTPVKQRRLADARFLRSTSIALSSLWAAASTLQGERSRTGWRAYGVHVISAVLFSVLPAIAHVSFRVALAAPNSACRPAGIARTSPVGTLCPPGRR